MTYVFNIQGVVENIGVCPSYRPGFNKYFFDLKKLDEIFAAMYIT